VSGPCAVNQPPLFIGGIDCTLHPRVLLVSLKAALKLMQIGVGGLALQHPLHPHHCRIVELGLPTPQIHRPPDLQVALAIQVRRLDEAHPVTFNTLVLDIRPRHTSSTYVLAIRPDSWRGCVVKVVSVWLS
jgi:hypothetical protein